LNNAINNLEDQLYDINKNLKTKMLFNEQSSLENKEENKINQVINDNKITANN
jgi:hypothetical protein